MTDHRHAVARACRVRPFLAVLLVAALAACSRDPAPAADAPVAAAPAPAPAAVPATPPAADAPKPDYPTLVVDTWDGGRFDLAAHRGKWVVVNFWATWCNPCLKEIPDLAEFDARRDDVQVVGLAYEEIERADMEAFLAEHPIPYPFAVIDVYTPPADFDTPRGLPMTYLIAPDGKVAKRFLGPVTSAELDKLIADAEKARS
jgi:thiol-disulfide isomerase/thioredoxin